MNVSVFVLIFILSVYLAGCSKVSAIKNEPVLESSAEASTLFAESAEEKNEIPDHISEPFVVRKGLDSETEKSSFHQKGLQVIRRINSNWRNQFIILKKSTITQILFIELIKLIYQV